MKKLDNIMGIIICLIIFLYSIFVGSPIKNNTNIINLIALIIFVLYIIITIIKEKKYKLVRSKIDIYIILLVFSTFIALILKNYSNLESTIETAIQYTVILSIYIIVRDLVTKDSKYINYIVNTLMLSSVIIFILGLDDLTLQLFDKLKAITGNVEIFRTDNRMLGIFGYANTTAILMLVVSIIAMGRYLDSKKIIYKVIYGIVVIINLAGIILSYSRSVWIFTIISYIIYFFLNKEKINMKHTIILIFLILFILITTYVIGTKMTKELVLYNNIDSNKKVTQDINNISPNKQYTFEFDINSKVAYTNKDIYVIEICERNKYDDILETHSIEFSNFDGIKDISFQTSKYTTKFLIEYSSKNRIAQRGLTINSMKMNNEEIPVCYKILPRKLVEKVNDINLKTISVTERMTYIKDACKLIKRYGIIGIGANGWKDRQFEVQEYSNYANEVHSSIIEIFLEFGIIGFIAIVGISITVIKIFIVSLKNKEKDVYINSIILAVITLLLHSFIDFELSFMYMLVVLFSLIAILSASRLKQNFKNDVIETASRVAIFIYIIVSMFYAIQICNSKYIRKQASLYSTEYIYNKINANNEEEFERNIEEVINREKYISHANEFRQNNNE